MSYYGSNEDKYLIKVDGGSTIKCSEYKKVKIEIPFLSVNMNKDSGEDFTFAGMIMSFFGEPEPTPAQKEVKYRDITVLSCYSDGSRLFFVSESDRAATMAALECGERCVDGDSTAQSEYAKACVELYHKMKWNNYSSDDNVVFLTDCFKKKDSVITVVSVKNVISQYEEQDKNQVGCESYDYSVQQRISEREHVQQLLAELERENAVRELEEERRKIAIKKAVDEKKNSYIELIKNKFDDLDLLRVQSLSNRGKFDEYVAVRKFCFEFFSLLSDHSFRIDEFYDEYSEYISYSSYVTFKENWIRMNRSYSALKRGIDGESKVYEVLRLFDDRILILKEYTWDNEHDFIVITPYGISTIEVKNLFGNYELSETGMLKCLSNQKVKSRDVAFQSKKHLEILRRNLKLCPAFNNNIPLQEIICSAEPNFTIKDNYGFIPICYYNTIDKFLLPNSCDEVLSAEQMREIYEFLLENQQEKFTFDVFLPKGEIDSRESFINAFSELAAVYMAIQTTI